MSQLRAFAWDTRLGTKGLSLCPIGARAAERPPVAAFQIGDAPSALSYRCRAVARRYEILLRASMRLRRCRSSRPRFVGWSESSTQLKQRRRRVTALRVLPRERDQPQSIENGPTVGGRAVPLSYMLLRVAALRGVLLARHGLLVILRAHENLVRVRVAAQLLAAVGHVSQCGDVRA